MYFLTGLLSFLPCIQKAFSHSEKKKPQKLITGGTFLWLEFYVPCHVMPSNTIRNIEVLGNRSCVGIRLLLIGGKLCFKPLATIPLVFLINSLSRLCSSGFKFQQYLSPRTRAGHFPIRVIAKLKNAIHQLSLCKPWQLVSVSSFQVTITLTEVVIYHNYVTVFNVFHPSDDESYHLQNCVHIYIL